MTKKTGFCKLCFRDRTLVYSHIYQKALYKDPFSKEKIGFVFSEASKEKKKYKQGIYGQFLCLECEKIFNLWDDQGYKLLNEKIHKKNYMQGPKLTDNVIEFFEIPKGDRFDSKEMLLMYFISILWRASVSNREEFSQVSLGEKFENKARQAILNSSSSYFPEVDVVLSKFYNGISGFLLPFKQKFGAVKGYRFAFPYYSCLVKVDTRSFPHQLIGASLNTSNSIIVLHRDWLTSPELLAMKKTVRKCA